MPLSLDQIAIKHGTDKSSEMHDYTAVYDPLLKGLRNQPITLLELGWGGQEDPDGGGASARMWREFFPKATIIVIDNEPKNVTDEGIIFRQGSQDDYDFLNGLADEFGDFDVIVDDASHLSSLTIRSFEILYRRLKPGGVYAVEDTHMSYHDFYYGKSEACADPEGRLPGGRRTWLQFAKRLSDEVNFKGRGDFDLFPEGFWWGYWLESVSFYFNLTVIRKRGV